MVAPPGSSRAVAPGLGGDVLERLGVYEHLCLPPRLDDRLVPRHALVKEAAGAAGPAVVLLSGPSGCGKTTLAAQIARSSGLAVVWVTADHFATSPMAVLRQVAASLSLVTPLPPSLTDALGRPDETWVLGALPRLQSVMRKAPPFVLVIEHLDALGDGEGLRCVERLAVGTPEHCRVLLSFRADPGLRMGAVHFHRRVFRFDLDDLAFRHADAVELARQLDVAASSELIDHLLGATGGWAAGVHAGLAALASPTPDPLATAAGAAERAFAQRGIFESLGADEQSLLVATSIVDRVCGSMADEVLDRRGSEIVLLRFAAEGHLTLVEETSDRRWYRVHPLLRAVARHRLDRRAEAELHAALSRWFERVGDRVNAVRHARASGDLARAGEIVWSEAMADASAGSMIRLVELVSLFTDEECASLPELCLSRAVLAMAAARPEEIDEWLSLALAVAVPARAPLSDGTPSVERAVRILRALVSNEDGPTQLALLGWPDDDDAVASNLCALGVCLAAAIQWLSGEAETSSSMFRHSEPGWLREPTMRFCAAAYLALMAFERGDHDDARRWEVRSRSSLAAHAAPERPLAMNGLLCLALLSAHAGDVGEAQRLMAMGRRMLDIVRYVAPRARLFGFLLGGEAELLCGNLDEARRMVAEAELLAPREYWAKGLQARLERVRNELAVRRRIVGALSDPGPASLTPAELRVLAYLPTHLSLREIGERLYRSSHTVKSQTVSTYRKLGVGSRSEAVLKARQLGLID